MSVKDKAIIAYAQQQASATHISCQVGCRQCFYVKTNLHKHRKTIFCSTIAACFDFNALMQCLQMRKEKKESLRRDETLRFETSSHRINMSLFLMLFYELMTSLA